MLEAAILGLLKERPMHGYELKKRLAYVLGHFWQVSYGSLYPALKRMERSGATEKTFPKKGKSSKSKRRNVYHLTPVGEKRFLKLLQQSVSESDIADTSKFDVKLSFFHYLKPKERLSLLEKRRTFLEEKLAEFKSYRKRNIPEDNLYRKGLFSHKLELARSDIRWLSRLIEQEKQLIDKDKKGKDGNLASGRSKEEISAESA